MLAPAEYEKPDRGRILLLTMALYAGIAVIVTPMAGSAIIWDSNTPEAIDPSPAVVNGIVFVGSGMST